MNPRRLRAYTYLILVAAIWGAAGPVIKFTLGGISPLQFLAYRFFISAIISIIYFSIYGINLAKVRKNLKWIIAYGLFAFSFSLGALFTGLEKTTVLDLALIATLNPLLITAGGAIIFKDHITRREKLGISVVLAGALINSIAPIFLDKMGVRFTGNIYIFAFLIFDTAAILLAKHIVRDKVDSITLTNLGFIVAALTIIPFAFLTEGTAEVVNSVSNLPLPYHLGVWYMALLSGTLAYFLYVRGQKSIEVSEAALFAYLQPIFSVPLAVFWLGESITTTFVIGAILITIGVVVAEYKKGKLKTKMSNVKSP